LGEERGERSGKKEGGFFTHHKGEREGGSYTFTEEKTAALGEENSTPRKKVKNSPHQRKTLVWGGWWDLCPLPFLSKKGGGEVCLFQDKKRGERARKEGGVGKRPRPWRRQGEKKGGEVALPLKRKEKGP